MRAVHYTPLTKITTIFLHHSLQFFTELLSIRPCFRELPNFVWHLRATQTWNQLLPTFVFFLCSIHPFFSRWLQCILAPLKWLEFQTSCSATSHQIATKLHFMAQTHSPNTHIQDSQYLWQHIATVRSKTLTLGLLKYESSRQTNLRFLCKKLHFGYLFLKWATKLNVTMNGQKSMKRLSSKFL